MKIFIRSVLLVSLLVIPAVTFAAEFRVGDKASVGAQENLPGNVYLAGGMVTSAGPVGGDLIVAGGQVVISGAVGADVAAAGGNISILSPVVGDVRAAGGSVVVQGAVGGDATLAGGQITLGGPGVRGDVAIGGGSIRIDAPISGNVRIGGGNVVINAPLRGNVHIDADSVTLGSGAVISGDFTYRASKELMKEDGAVVQGPVHFQMKERATSAAGLAALLSVWLVVKFLSLLVCSLVFGLVLRRYSVRAADMAVQNTLVNLGRGLLIMILLPVVSVVLLVTVIGIPLGILGLLSFVGLMLVAWVVSPIIVGSAVYRTLSKGKMEVSWKTILLGVLIDTILSLVPFVGWLALFLITMISLGIIADSKWEVIKSWR